MIDPSQSILWSRDKVERALAADDAEALLSAVIAVSMHEEDQKYSEQLCLRLSRHSHFNVRGNAILGFGHIARIHGKLNQEFVYPIIADALKDGNEYIRGQAECAKDDTTQFLGWKYENGA
jgi:hypothetical protein